MKIALKIFWWLVGFAGSIEDLCRWLSVAATGGTVFTTGLFSIVPMPYVLTATCVAIAAVLVAWSKAIEIRLRRPFISAATSRADVAGPDMVVVKTEFENATVMPAYRIITAGGWCFADDPDSFKLTFQTDGPFRLGPGPSKFINHSNLPKQDRPLWIYLGVAYSSSERPEAPREYLDESFFLLPSPLGNDLGLLGSGDSEMIRRRISLRKLEAKKS